MSNLGGKYEEIAIELIEENEWNPNMMRDKEFDRLVREINENGMIAPIQVVPMEKEEGVIQYRIIGGAHRFNVCKLLGYKEIPAIILEDEKWQDEGLQKLETVRLNIIKGGLNSEKMVQLYQDVSDQYGQEGMADLMGFTDEELFGRCRS